MISSQFAPYAYFVLGESHPVTRLWFPYKDSLLFVAIFGVTGFVQDLFLIRFVMRQTDCSYSYFFGRPLFSWPTFRIVWSLSAMTIISSYITHQAYAFEQEKVGTFAVDEEI